LVQKRRWENNVKIYATEMEREGVNWISLVEDKVQGFCEHGNDPSSSIKTGEPLDQLSDY
jgi:hypothetical protein